MYKAVIFDLFGTLVAQTAVERPAMKAMKPRAGCMDVLRQLKAEGYLTGAVGGCSPEAPPSWGKTEMAALLDAAVFSCDEKVGKPDVRVYRSICERLGVQPDECVYVGDGGGGELGGALKAGLHPVLLLVPYDHEHDFPRRGVEDWKGTRISGLEGVLSFLRDQERAPQVSFYDIGHVPEERFRFAVIAAQACGKWVFARHRSRSTWEIPGGHREDGEEIAAAAERELVEETGALRFTIIPVCDYSVTFKGKETFGRLFLAELFETGPMPDSEIGETRLFESLPEDLTYPDIQPHLMRCVADYVKRLR